MAMTVPTQPRKPLPRPVARQRVLRIVYSPDSDAVGRELPLSGETFELGREVGKPGRVEDHLMSRAHARVYQGEGGTFLIDDLQSRNGTFVDGERLDVPAVLSANRVLLLGATLLIVDQEPHPDLLPAREDEDSPQVPEVIGVSMWMDRVRRSLATVAQAERHILLRGPTGSGKEVAAKAIHRISGRPGPFIAVNSSAIQANLAESELFGHARGAFTGADAPRQGAFRLASRGTLFFDEIGDLPLEQQAKLLRVLEDGIVRSLGSDEEERVDVRIISATNRNLESATFRGDLFARLSGWPLHLPALVERRVDIIPLFDHFSRGAPLTPEAAEVLLLQPWPGNVRDLRDLAKRLVDMRRDREPIGIERLPEEMQAHLRRREEEFDDSRTDDRIDLGENAPSCEVLRQELIRCNGNVSQVASEKGWHRTQVQRWMKRCRFHRLQFVR